MPCRGSVGRRVSPTAFLPSLLLVAALKAAAADVLAQPQARWRPEHLVHDVRALDIGPHPPAHGRVVDPPAGPARRARAVAIPRAVLVSRLHRVRVVRTSAVCVLGVLPASVG